MHLQSTPDNSNLEGKLKKVRVIGSLSYRKLRTNGRKKGKKQCLPFFCSYSVQFKQNNYFRVKRGQVKMNEYISKLLFES